MALLEDGNLRGPSKEACRGAVAVRESLRARGLIPEDSSRELPVPLRVATDGAHGHLPVAPTKRIDERLAYGYRPAALRVLA
jgi:hypothetical protein